MNIDLKISDLRLNMDSAFEETVTVFCNHNNSSRKEKYIMQNWYEGWMYTVLLGIKKNDRIKKKGNLIQKAPKWSDRYIGGLKYIFGILLSDNSIREEIGLNSRETIKEKNLDPQEIINRLYKICDEYSRGGLSYIEELLEEDNQIFLDPFSFKNIIENAN